MNRIHPTAIIDESAVIGDDNFIGPYTVIGPNVRIGDGNHIQGFASIGSPAEHIGYWKKEPGGTVIGNNNVIREFVTINSGTRWSTIMSDNCIMLRGSHLSHDSVLEEDVTVSCSVLIGGETRVMIGANLGLGCKIHQRQLIGSYSMIGMGSVVTKGLNVVPGNIYCGNPAKLLKQNIVGLHRMRVTTEQLNSEIKIFTELRSDFSQKIP